MGALTGSMSTTKFHVPGELPKNMRRSFMERIALRTFRPLEPEEEAEERAGWCALGQPLDLELSSDKVFNGLYLTLGFRLDRYRFPARVVPAELAKASRAALAKSGQRQGISKRSGPVALPEVYISRKGRSAFAAGRSHAGSRGSRASGGSGSRGSGGSLHPL